MTDLQALILGIIQGITEFFPVSSSAHLRIAKRLLGINDGEGFIYFDLLCHIGTLIALIIFLRKPVFNILSKPKQWPPFFLALLPLIPGYFLLKPLRSALSEPTYTGFFLLITSVLLFLASKKKQPFELNLPENKWKNVLWIGMAQTLALIPGISRSGSTIATARFCGWSLRKGAEFSFLLAIPTIIGGECLESYKLLKGTSDALHTISPSCYAIGLVASFFVGLFTCRAVFWIYERNIIRPFAWYCLVVGCLALAIFNG